MAKAAGSKGASRISVFSQRDFIPTASAQLGWGVEDGYTARKWAMNSKMADRYVRLIVSSELALRLSVADATRECWKPVPGIEAPGAALWTKRHVANPRDSPQGRGTSKTARTAPETSRSERESKNRAVRATLGFTPRGGGSDVGQGTTTRQTTCFFRGAATRL